MHVCKKPFVSVAEVRDDAVSDFAVFAARCVVLASGLAPGIPAEPLARNGAFHMRFNYCKQVRLPILHISSRNMVQRVATLAALAEM